MAKTKKDDNSDILLEDGKEESEEGFNMPEGEGEVSFTEDADEALIDETLPVEGEEEEVSLEELGEKEDDDFNMYDYMTNQDE